MIDAREVEAVHDCILDYLIKYEELPKPKQVAALLDIPKTHVNRCIMMLQETGRLRKGQLYPIAYDTYFRKHIAPKKWDGPQLAPLPKTTYKQSREKHKTRPAQS